MDTTEIVRRLKEIEECCHDPEVAHMKQDQLYFDVLYAISRGAENPIELAELALQSESLNFPRWYA